MVSPSVSLSTLARDVRDVQSVLKAEDDHSELEVKGIAEMEQDALMHLIRMHPASGSECFNLSAR